VTKICKHYEAKCSGEYKTLASRYVLQMGKEIRSQIDALLEKSEENINMSDYKPNFKRDEMNMNAFNNIKSDLCDPKGLNDNFSMMKSQEVKAFERQVNELNDELKKTSHEMQRTKERAQEILDSRMRKYKERINLEQNRCRKAQHMFEAREKQLKEEARLVNSYIRRKANEVIECKNDEIENLKKEMRGVIANYEEEVKDSVNKRLCKLEDNFRLSVRNEKLAIDRNILSMSFSRGDTKENKPIYSESGDFSIVSDRLNSMTRFSDDSISTRKSARSGEDKDATIRHLRSRIRELEKTNETLTTKGFQAESHIKEEQYVPPW
jgi:hypothetical protein